MLDFTCMLYGGVNQIIFLFLLRLGLRLLVLCVFSVNLILLLENPLFLSASVYILLFLSNISLLDELRDILVSMECGIFLIIEGGWLDLVLMYLGVWFSLMYGLKVPLFRLSVTSRKLTILMPESISTLKPNSLSSFVMYFRALSHLCPLASLTINNPSSRYKPTFVMSVCLVILYNISKINDTIMESRRQHVK